MYPGDLVLRIGRRVCRKAGEWIDPVPVDETAKAQERASFVCGELREIKGDKGIIKVWRKGWWSYPLRLLEVNHSQENMTDEQYLWALRRLRQIIENSDASGYDCTAIGNKSTEFNWGFCNDAVWHIGRPNRQKHQPCPLDKELKEHTGCFYRCRFFQNNWRNKRLVLDLYDRQIERMT